MRFGWSRFHRFYGTVRASFSLGQIVIHKNGKEDKKNINEYIYQNKSAINFVAILKRYSL